MNNARTCPAPDLPSAIPSLDGLRAISIGLVFIAHAAGTTQAPKFLDPLVPIGNLGVKVFFVISGFLITTLLLREFAKTGSVSLRDFYIRRVLRIFPAFYAYIAIIVALHLLGFLPLAGRDLIHALTYTANYNAHSVSFHFDPAQEWYLNHLWSLSVEEQFYMLWPATFVFVGPRRGTWIVVGTVLAVPLIRLAMWLSLPPLPPAAYTRQFQSVADSLATGCLLALSYNWLTGWSWYLKLLSSRWFLGLAAAGILSALLLFKIDNYAYYIAGQTLVNLVIGVCVDRSVRFPDTHFGRLLNLGPIKFVGILSYSLYLWQEPFLNPFDETSFHTRFPWNLGFAIVAAVASYYVVERPFLKFRRYFSQATERREVRDIPATMTA